MEISETEKDGVKTRHHDIMVEEGRVLNSKIGELRDRPGDPGRGGVE